MLREAAGGGANELEALTPNLPREPLLAEEDADAAPLFPDEDRFFLRAEGRRCFPEFEFIR